MNNICDECDNQKAVKICLSCRGIFCKDCGFVPTILSDRRIIKDWWCPICGAPLYSFKELFDDRIYQ
jgi:rubrerythrin